MTTSSVLGLDLSLTSTGLAFVDDGVDASTDRFRTRHTGHERLNAILIRIHEAVECVSLVVVEGPAFGARGSAFHQLAGLWWLVTQQLWADSIPYAVAPPSAVKRYATGKGNGGKDDVLREVTKRFPWFDGGNDEADALVLAAMGADHLGQPLTPMPATHRAALDGVQWPETA